MKTLGEKAKEFRESKGWNAGKMARMVGTTRQTIENMEAKGDYRPRFIVELAKVMGVSVDYLLNDVQQTPESAREVQVVSNTFAVQLARLIAALPEERQAAAFNAATQTIIGFLTIPDTK